MLFSKRPTDSLILILDIQSSVVCGALVHMKGDEAPHVLFTYRKVIAYKPHTDSSYLIKTTLKAISETIENSLKYVSVQPKDTIPKHVSAVHYVLCSPWVVSQAKKIVTSFTEDTEISRNRVMGMLAEERSKLMPADENKIEIIEEKIFDVRLNGYAVSSWEGKRAKDLEVGYVISVAGASTIQHFHDACGHIVAKNKVFFHSSLLLQHIGIRQELPDLSSYALVHIHGELTDVVMVQGHSCVFFGSYPMGFRTIVRKIAHGTKTDYETADSVLGLYSQKSLDSGGQKSLNSVLEGASSGWIGEFRKLLVQAGSARSIPQDILISSRMHENFFTQVFADAYPQSHIESLEKQRFAGHVTFDGAVEERQSTRLYVSAIHSIQVR